MMNTHEHLRRLVEAREVDSIRDRKHEFSVLAGIRPNLPSLEEAGWGDIPKMKMPAPTKKLPDDYPIKPGLKADYADSIAMVKSASERQRLDAMLKRAKTLGDLKPIFKAFVKMGMATEDLDSSGDDLAEALGVPALNKWKMHQKGGTTAYAITLHGKKVIVGETPSPKGSGLYRYSLYIDGAKYGKQDFTSTRDLFQTIQKAVVEGDDHPFDEAYGDISMVGSFKNKAGDKVAIYKGPDGYFIQGKTGAGKMIMASGFKSEKDATKWLIKKRIKTEGHDEADDIEEAARPTFKKAREALLKYLDKEGWDVKTWGPGGALKIPHAMHPHQNLKLWFKGQAVYQSGAKGNIKQARSTWVDIRDMSPEEFVQEVEK